MLTLAGVGPHFCDIRWDPFLIHTPAKGVAEVCRKKLSISKLDECRKCFQICFAVSLEFFCLTQKSCNGEVWKNHLHKISLLFSVRMHVYAYAFQAHL